MSLRRAILSALTGLTLICTTSAPSVHALDQSWKINKKDFSKKTAGYLSRVSVLPDSLLQVFVTCSSTSYTLELFRMGYFGGAGAATQWKSEPIRCTKQINPVRATNFDPLQAHWINPVTIDTTDREPGFYLVKILSSDNGAAFMPLVIRSPSLVGAVVMSMPDLTSLAYNKWGGASAYVAPGGFTNRARNFSFDLPFSQGFGSGIYLNYLHPLLMVATSLDIKLAYVSDVDVATIPHLLDGAHAYVSPGHDEYWTKAERESVMQARSEGTNLLFFGANVAYWRIRLTGGSATSNPAMAVYKSSESDPDKSAPTIRFRDTGAHEEALTGLKYRCFPARGDFEIKDATSFIFANTSATVGALYPGLIGPQVDAFNGINYTPGETAIIAASRVACGRESEKRAHSEMVYSVLPSNGAATISVGTMNWVMRGLSREAPTASSNLAIQMTRNILLAANEGPIGVEHPLAPNEIAK